MTPPQDPSGSHFWPSLPLPGYDHPVWWVVGIALYLIGVAAMVWVSLINETAAGGPADEAAPTAGSSMTAAAPAPTAPDPSAGAVGVTPDDFPWFDARSAREAAQAAEVEALTGGGR